MQEDTRPDPDRLLALVRADESRATRGRLRVFVGMCPGVGKTYAMLEAAQERRRAGEPALVGLVETHGRHDTKALLDGLDVLPRRTFAHRGVELNEFDLDAALARVPSLVVLDELPHTNAPGSRHAKRWQDVEELVRAGFTVYTALNVQHIESLNDAVAQITGVRVRETVPDKIIESADEVVLVDLAPEELIERLREGKVYVGEQAARAEDRFFKSDKLVALRELSLRYVAERVGARVPVARTFAGATAIWPTRERLLVGVGPSPSSARLVRATKRLAGVLQCPWIAVSVETPETPRLPDVARARIAEHLRLAEQLGAEVATVEGSTIADAILSAARDRNVTKVVVGKPVQPRWRDILHPSPVDELIRRSGDIDIYVMKGDEAAPHRLEAASAASEIEWGPYGTALGAVAAASGITTVMDRTTGWFGLTDIAMVFVAAVALASLAGSRRAAVLGSALAVVAFNFLFVPPRYTLAIDSPQYLVTFAMMFLASLTVGTLSVRLREQRDLARQGTKRAETLRHFAESLSAAGVESDLCRIVAEETGRAFGGSAHLYVPDGAGSLVVVPPDGDAKELAVARWVFDHRQSAGRGTQTLASARYHHTPILTGEVCHAALAVELPEEQPSLFAEQRFLLDALARQAALALDARRLERERRQARLEVENERLRSSILSAVSHDLRTPLASILGSASSLQEQADALDPATRRELLATIAEEADRLNRLIANLLEMTKIDGGVLRLNLVALPVDEIVGAALHATRRLTKNRVVTTSIPADLPFAEADELLVQQVLINLLENACKHTSPGTPIEVGASKIEGSVCITVADRGRGLPDTDPAKLFERFYRGDRTGTGTGLGLAICKGIIDAHGGAISARNRDGGGAEFSFTLPVAPAAPPPDDDLQEAPT